MSFQGLRLKATERLVEEFDKAFLYYPRIKGRGTQR
jgi:hypothetical protein